MIGTPLYFIVLGLALFFFCLVASPLLAARKGYAWYLWTMAGGLIGLIVLACLPYANKPDNSDQVNRSRRQTGNIVGAVFSGLGLLGVFIVVTMALVAMATMPSGRRSWVLYFLESLLVSLPYYCVEVIGGVLALTWWRRQPRVALLTFLGLALLLLTSLMRSFLFAWLPEYLRDVRGWSFSQVLPLYPVLGMFLSILGAAAFLLLVLAVFSGRARADQIQPPRNETSDLEAWGIQPKEPLQPTGPAP
jgi:hypothetical protein